MAQNKFSNLSQAGTVTLATNMSTAFTGSPTSYGLTAPQATALSTALNTYNDAITDYDKAETAFRAAAQAKLAAKEGLAGLMSDQAKIAYAYPGITNQLLADAGLAIYATPGIRLPQTPTQLVASPSPDGDVRLKWNRNGNTYGIVFEIEAKPEGGNWEIVASTTAARATLQNYTPGVPAWFRVVAVNRGIRSTASLEVSIYHDTQVVQLQVAA